MEHTITFQDYGLYMDEDHQTWALLNSRHKKIQTHLISNEYLEGLEILQMDECRIVNLEELSKKLKVINGWTLLPVTGLMPAKDFFCMLIDKKYPITVTIRKPCPHSI